MSLISRLKDRVKRMLGSNDFPVIEKMKTAMTDQQSLWKSMYLNKSPWLSKTVQSLNLAATIAAEVSRLITLEIKSEVDAEDVNTVYQREVMKGLRTQIEYGLALGGLILKPYIQNDTVRVDFAQPSDFQILKAGSDGIILEVTFRDYLKFKNDWYARLEYHIYNESTSAYLIKNRVFKSDNNGEIRQEIYDYTKIEPWAELLPELELQNIKAPLFGYFKPAISNNIDTKSAVGVSIYSRAVEAIERADKGLSAMLREFRVKEAKQYVSTLAVKNTDQPLPYLEDDYYIKLNTSGGKSGTEEFFESYSPDIYVDKYLAALNEYKREIEDCIGLAHGTISQVEDVAKTATEMKISRQRTYVLISESQSNLQDALEGVAYAISVWLKYPAAPSELTVTTDFDDSMITDWETELSGMQDDVASGLIRPEIYLARKYGITEDEALAMMPGSEQLLR